MTAITMPATPVDSTSGSHAYQSNYAADQVPYMLDPILYMILVSIDAQNSDQHCMATLTDTLEKMSQAGVDGVNTGTKILEKDNANVQKQDKSEDIQKAQASMQVDNTKINNMNQQFSTATQSLETGVNALNTSDQNESEFIKSVLGVYDNANNLVAQGL